ncbi:serine/threonine-protein kinase 32B-like isoform X2 [Paramacrobiotus metropolitanus]|uniref:serine/threonine-protein kinase 32B-like isoform X2 n=1 Tax=Paramacrobiotus metropolitanus TaxID=2943436 RepID=UPI002445AB1E|nr:serine/threonine-protein kinase 32B-like isoform X2 [Paramacrobiotus metropolitanus]
MDRASYEVKGSWSTGKVCFDHFQILRAIGRGSFGKVCIVQKKDSKVMYAMKYMNKRRTLEKASIRNVLREIDILINLDHPFLVNLWYTFQDEEDMFMVVDLLLGGDLRYHLDKLGKLPANAVKLYVCEIGLALDYLQKKGIIHRDIKPENVLLDEEGHVHITDFNIAAVMGPDVRYAAAISGTKPYMAPEVYDCIMDDFPGYSYPVDWWSLGITAYELLRGKRPFEIHSNTSLADIRQIHQSIPIQYPAVWDKTLIEMLSCLLTLNPQERTSNIESLAAQVYLSDINMEAVYKRQIKPEFIPPKDHLNCDPTFELEEMIIESNPLHKKKKRLAKQMSRKDLLEPAPDEAVVQAQLQDVAQQFKVFDRVIARREQLRREQEQFIREISMEPEPSRRSAKKTSSDTGSTTDR